MINWPNLTYGDDCSNIELNLQRVTEGDILLSGHALDNIGSGWLDFTGQKGWYLLGALRAVKFLEVVSVQRMRALKT